jgi:membrane-bound inhibitor of C-type lysozyme
MRSSRLCLLPRSASRFATGPSRSPQPIGPRRRAWVALAAATALALQGCAAPGLPETVLPAENVYVCENGATLKVVRAPDGRAAEVTFGGKRTLLPRTESAAQEKYGDGRTTLYLEGEKALLTADSMVVAGRCTSAVPLPVVPQTRY